MNFFNFLPFGCGNWKNSHLNVYFRINESILLTVERAAVGDARSKWPKEGEKRRIFPSVDEFFLLFTESLRLLARLFGQGSGNSFFELAFALPLLLAKPSKRIFMLNAISSFCRKCQTVQHLPMNISHASTVSFYSLCDYELMWRGCVSFALFIARFGIRIGFQLINVVHFGCYCFNHV